ncbi:MAG: ABC transporter ATP-binding protein, partial [Clostridium sp.]|nr:ABC transporter ATP-binding protein [Clostridium sp.]
MKNILELKDVQTYIGQFHILSGVSLEIEQGKATVILGRNGAGKTTTLETIMGLRPASSGQIVLDGEDITKLKDYQIPKKGIGYVPEDREVFSDLTVEENLVIASRDKSVYKKKLDFVFELFPDMKKYFKHKSRILSGGQQQMLSISRSLINDNKVILIDEPSKGLAPLIIEDLIDKINEIKKTNTIIMVEQNFDMATRIGDVFYIVDDGKT